MTRTEPSPKAMLQTPGCRLAKPPTNKGEPGLAGPTAVAAGFAGDGVLAPSVAASGDSAGSAPSPTEPVPTAAPGRPMAAATVWLMAVPVLRSVARVPLIQPRS